MKQRPATELNSEETMRALKCAYGVHSMLVKKEGKKRKRRRR